MSSLISTFQVCPSRSSLSFFQPRRRFSQSKPTHPPTGHPHPHPPAPPYSRFFFSSSSSSSSSFVSALFFLDSPLSSSDSVFGNNTPPLHSPFFFLLCPLFPHRLLLFRSNTPLLLSSASLTRYRVRSEYGLADPELYRAADEDDPEALLEGVAMAGLVGVLCQLGNLAE
ncbi:hypothetical protein L484_009180 [Morus notabilis]|uniref:Uncharacterized protein n=2 Tax=Morus notabilis TaxID=981085 RepID=W9RYL4_9ROSA|nr:hypothetical protein L484_009180 [Morus notabilis]